jgi:hypothetical protein
VDDEGSLAAAIWSWRCELTGVASPLRADLPSQLIDLTNEVEEGLQAAYQRTGILLVVPSSRTTTHLGTEDFMSDRSKLMAAQQLMTYAT